MATVINNMEVEGDGVLRKISSTTDFKLLMYKARDKRREYMSLTLKYIGKKCSFEEFQQTTINCQNFLQMAERTLVSRSYTSPTKQQLADFILDSSSGQSDSLENGPSLPRSTNMNISDEVSGLRRDVHFLSSLIKCNCNIRTCFNEEYSILCKKLLDIDQDDINRTIEFISNLSNDAIVITDWDGTLKTYCCQYTTCIQDIMSALPIALYAQFCTQLTAVLTAGPLQNGGITDLTCIPADHQHVTFGGSLGRQWSMHTKHGKKIVGEDSTLTLEGQNLLDKVVLELNKLHSDNAECAQFALVGSGVQRKFDRVSIGTQSVAMQVSEHDKQLYTDEIRNLVKRCDPDGLQLAIDEAEWDIDVAIKQQGSESKAIWDKAAGVRYLCSQFPLDLTQHDVLVCGDTMSDVPMADTVLELNPERGFIIFVNTNDKVKDAIVDLIKVRGVDQSHVLYVSHPVVIAAAFAKIVANKLDSNPML